MRIFLLMLVLLASTVVLADVYRSVDENGNVVYSDKPSPDAEKIQVDEIQTIKGDEVKPFKYTPPASDKGAASPYAQVRITSPQNNETVRANAGNVSVSVETRPTLIPGHKVVLYLDGSSVAEGGTQIGLENVDRGTHSLSAAITASGRELVRSSPVIFTVQRVSVGDGGGNSSPPPVSPTNPPKPPAPPVSPTNPPKPKAP